MSRRMKRLKSAMKKAKETGMPQRVDMSDLPKERSIVTIHSGISKAFVLGMYKEAKKQYKKLPWWKRFSVRWMQGYMTALGTILEEESK